MATDLQKWQVNEVINLRAELIQIEINKNSGVTRQNKTINANIGLYINSLCFKNFLSAKKYMKDNPLN